MAKKNARRTKADRAHHLSVADTGTPERWRKGDIIEMHETTQAGVKVARVITVSMIDRYLHKKHITTKQSDAAKRILTDWVTAGRQMSVVSGYGQTGGGSGEMTERAAEAHSRYVAALRAAGQELSPVLVHVVLLDGSASDWANATRREPKAGIEILRLALNALARYYRLT